MRCFKELVLAALIFPLAASRAETVHGPVVDSTLSVYAKPQRRVRLPDGRKMHLFCIGQGSPTVILVPGLGNWSLSWSKVHPQIAHVTRACSWDPAGWGYSDPSPHPQDADHMQRDLKATLAAARIREPYVLVGHSLGSFETRLFKYRNPRQVVGMVLIEGSVEFQDERLRLAAPRLSTNNDMTAFAKNCLGWLNAGVVAPSSPNYTSCVGSANPEYPPDLQAAVLRMRLNPDIPEAYISRVENILNSSKQLARERRSFGTMPLVVLTATTGTDFAPELAEDSKQYDAAWQQMQTELKSLSSQGVQRRVPNAGHNIQDDQPQAVIGAVEEVVRQARTRGQ